MLALREALGIAGPAGRSPTCRCWSAPTGPSCRSATAPCRWRTSGTAATCPRRCATTSACWASRCRRTSDGSTREIVPLDELVAGFDLARVAPSPAFFDHDKLDWMNGEYIRALPAAEFVERCLPFGRQRYGDRLDARRLRRRHGHRPGAGDDAPRGGRNGLVPVRARGGVRHRPRVAGTAARHRPGGGDPRGGGRDTSRPASGRWRASTCGPSSRSWTIKPRKGLPAVYAAVEGTHAGLPLFDSIVLLGRDRSVARVRAARRLVA